MTALLAALLAFPVHAADLEWKVSSATSALVGAETVVGYRITLPAGAKLVPDPLASSTTDLIVVQAGFDAASSAWTWTLLPVEEGRLDFTARWTLDGQPISAPAVELAVRMPDSVKEEAPSDIRPPKKARAALWPWLLATLVLLLAGLAWRRWKHRSRPGSPDAPPEPEIPAEERARRALLELSGSGLWERGEFVAYYLRLTDVLREYLERRYDEPATAMTSGEVSRMVRARTGDLRIATSVREVLGRADLVKFARLTPARDEGPADAALIGSVVDATTPAPARAAEETPR